MNLSFKSFMATVDAIVIIVERYFEFKLLVEYHKWDHTAWLGLTVTSLLLPGPVGAILWTAHAMKKRTMEDISLRLIFGGAACLMVWPISSVIWYDRHEFLSYFSFYIKIFS